MNSGELSFDFCTGGQLIAVDRVHYNKRKPPIIMSGCFSNFLRAAAGCLGTIVVMSSLGCGSGVKPPALHPVSGKVTFDGKPVPGAMLVFIPANEDPQKPSNERSAGKTDDEGTYELTWGIDEVAGSPAGKFKVFITAFKAVDENFDNEEKPPSLIPEKYNSPVSSGLTAEVKEGDENVINFELVP
jgi:hypothetical protein